MREVVFRIPVVNAEEKLLGELYRHIRIGGIATQISMYQYKHHVSFMSKFQTPRPGEFFNCGAAGNLMVEKVNPSTLWEQVTFQAIRYNEQMIKTMESGTRANRPWKWNLDNRIFEKAVLNQEPQMQPGERPLADVKRFEQQAKSQSTKTCKYCEFVNPSQASWCIKCASRLN